MRVLKIYLGKFDFYDKRKNVFPKKIMRFRKSNLILKILNIKRVVEFLKVEIWR